MTPYVGLLGHAGADYLGLGPFAPLVAKSLGFTARVGDPKNAPLTTWGWVCRWWSFPLCPHPTSFSRWGIDRRHPIWLDFRLLERAIRQLPNPKIIRQWLSLTHQPSLVGQQPLTSENAGRRDHRGEIAMRSGSFVWKNREREREMKRELFTQWICTEYLFSYNFTEFRPRLKHGEPWGCIHVQLVLPLPLQFGCPKRGKELNSFSNKFSRVNLWSIAAVEKKHLEALGQHLDKSRRNWSLG